jgi:hypothetical protein
MDTGTHQGWVCANCGGWVTPTGQHICAARMPRFPSAWMPTNYDPLILAELQAIRALLEKIAANHPLVEIESRVGQAREGIERGAAAPGETFKL